MIRQNKENQTHHDIYRKIKTIGAGNFGKACLVESKINNHLYIIKKIRCSTDKNQAEAVLNEVNAMKKVKHPYVIAYKESYLEKAHVCIVMEYAKGGDLHARVLQQRKLGLLFEEEQVWEWFIQLCLGLKCVHEHRIVHRDFKSENIFLTDKELCKIGDFGICKMMKQTYDLAETKIGTPYCMAPEIWEGKAYNQKSDIWSLGCVLYQLCTLEHPFNADNNGVLCLKILNGEPQKKISSKYSQELRGLVSELLNKEPHKRPSVSTILEKDFIRRRKKNIFSKTMNISYQESLQLSQKLNCRNKPVREAPLLRPRSLSLPNIAKVVLTKMAKPKLKLSQYKQSYPIIQQQNKALKEQLQTLQKQKDECQAKFQQKIREINNLLEDEFTSVHELKEVIKEKLGLLW